MKQINHEGHILITGASSDIGFEIASALDKMGVPLILHTSSDAGRTKLTQRFEANVHTIWQLDFNEADKIDSELSDMLINSPVSGLVNCVGMRSRRPIKLLRTDHVKEVFQLNFFSFLEVIRTVVKKEHHRQGCSIINISSISADSGGASVTAYAASKAAGDVALRCLSKELFSKGLRFNSIRCGQVNTSTYRDLQADKASDPVLLRQYAGLLAPTDVTELVLFLLSEKSKKITGEYFNMDGGYLQ